LNDELTIDSDGNVESTGTFRFGGVSDNFVEFNGTDLIAATPFLDFDADSVTLGNKESGQFLEFSGGVLQLGPKANIGSNDNITVTVGSGGDYATINFALEALSRTVPAYKNGGFTAKIEILAGYEETENIEIVGIDLSWIEIFKSSSLDVSLPFYSLGSLKNWFSVSLGARSPLINFSVAIVSTDDLDSMFYANEGSSIKIGAGHTYDGTGVCNWILKAENGSQIICGQSNTFDNDDTFALSITDSQAFLPVNTIRGTVGATENATVNIRSCDITTTNAVVAGISSSMGSIVQATGVSVTATANDVDVFFGGTVVLDRNSGLSTNVAVNAILYEGIIFG